jgi:putative ABC transport system permease protein
MASSVLWVRWSWRDLRRRWPQVAAIALVIALGTGTYAGLMSTSAWRTQSNDASFTRLHLHDLRVSLNEGTTVPEGSLAQLARGIPTAAALTGVRERLVVPTQVAGPPGLLVPGEVVGSATGPATEVDTVSNAAGRALSTGDDGRPVAVLERQFATKNQLPAAGRLRLSGGTSVRYVGHGQSPEYFLVAGKQGALPFLSQKSFGVLFTSLHSAQLLTGAPGRVNDLVVTTRPGAAAAVRADLQRALNRTRPALSAELTARADVDAYRVLYDDIAGDERLWRIVSLLVLSGAAFAAFNLTSRIVEAQRREIGIGMALGVPSRQLAVRPLLFGAEVALIGVLLGIGVGWLIGIPLRGVFMSILPLPVWQTPFQVGTFAQAAILGFALPFLAIAWPVWRALRVQPVEAIRVGHLAARGRGLPRPLSRMPVPGRSYRQVPVRNVLRNPRRTLLTTLGIAAAITTLVTTMGFLDSFNATLDRSERDVLRTAPDRVTVSLRTLQPTDAPAVTAVRALPEVRSVDVGLLVPATAHHGGTSVELLTEVLGPTAPWRPTIVDGTATGGLVLARKAAADLHVNVGDTIALEHPQPARSGLRTVTTQVPVAGLHPNPMRVFAYLDPATARTLGLADLTNLLTVVPAADVTPAGVQRALLALPTVASAQQAKATTAGMRDSLQEFLGILQVAAAVTLLLALLIAFNTSSIGMDERSREHATMLAFGLPTRTVLGMAITESAIIGILATALGVGGGYYLLSWLTATSIADVLPEIGVTASLATSTLVLALTLGILTVALAPLLTARKLRILDIPSTLRLVE